MTVRLLRSPHNEKNNGLIAASWRAARAAENTQREPRSVSRSARRSVHVLRVLRPIRADVARARSVRTPGKATVATRPPGAVKARRVSGAAGQGADNAPRQFAIVGQLKRASVLALFHVLTFTPSARPIREQSQNPPLLNDVPAIRRSFPFEKMIA